MSNWFLNNIRTIDIDLDEIIGDIPTEMLEDELEERKALQKSNPERAKKDEWYRSSAVDYEINIGDYGLIDEDDVNLNSFDNCELIREIENRGYKVLPEDDLLFNEIGGLPQYLSNLQPWKLKDFLCDFLGINHLSNKEQIIDELKNML